MKTIQSFFSMVGLGVAMFVLGASGAKAQVLNSPDFTGTFTISHIAQWGATTLPAGEYTLKYGYLDGGADAVEIAGKAKGSPRVTMLAVANGRNSEVENSLACIREGNTLVVQRLDLPAIDKSLNFAMPHGTTLVAHRQNRGEYTLAGGPMLIQRVPVTANQK